MAFGSNISSPSLKKIKQTIQGFKNPPANTSLGGGPTIVPDTSGPRASFRNPDGSLKRDQLPSGGGGGVSYGSVPTQVTGGFGAQDAADVLAWQQQQAQKQTDRALSAEGTANVMYGKALAGTLDKYRSLFGSYLEYGPSNEFVTDAARRLQELENNPDAYLNRDTAYGQFKDAMAQELERAMIAQGHNPAESGFGAASQQEALARVRLDYLNSLRDTFLKEMQAANPLQQLSLSALQNLMGYDITNNPAASTLAGLAQLAQVNNMRGGQQNFEGIMGSLEGTGVSGTDLQRFLDIMKRNKINYIPQQLPATISAARTRNAPFVSGMG